MLAAGAAISQCPQSQPNETSDEIKYEGRDCFKVKSLIDEWIEIFSTDYCDEGKNKDKIKSVMKEGKLFVDRRPDKEKYVVDDEDWGWKRI